MWIRESRHQATTLAGAVPGVHFGRQYISGGEASTSVRVIETTTFDKLDGKKFELRDAFSNNKYKFKLVKRKGEWMVIYPIRKWRMSKK